MVQTHTQYMEHRPRAALTVGVFILLTSTAPCALVDLHILYVSEGGVIKVWCHSLLLCFRAVSRFKCTAQLLIIS